MSGTFSVGYDASWVVITPYGNRLDLTGLVDVDWTRVYKKLRHEPLNAPPQGRDLPAGHELKLKVERKNPSIETLASQIEQGWWASGSQDAGTTNTGQIYLYYNNPDGSQTTHQFSGVTMSFPKGAMTKIDTPIPMEIEAFASTEQVVS